MGYQKSYRICGSQKMTTFKPLGRNRVRCNQTGDEMPRKQAEGYRNRRHANLYPRRPDRQRAVRRPVRYVEYKKYQTSVTCPACGKWHSTASKIHCICGVDIHTNRAPRGW